MSVTKLCPTLCGPMNCSMPASLSSPISQSLLRLMSIESVMPSNHLILCRPLLLLPIKCLVGCKFWVIIVLVPKPHGATPCEQPRREVLSGERGLEPRLLTPGQLPRSVSPLSVKFRCLCNLLDTIVVSRIMLVVDLCSQLYYLPLKGWFLIFPA